MMHHHADVRLLLLLIASLIWAGFAAWGFIGFLAGKHGHTAARALILIGVGNALIGFSLGLPPASRTRAVVFWTACFLAMCGAIVAATAAKRRKYDRESRRPVSY